MRKASFLLIALTLLAACGSSSLGDLGNIILGSPSAQQASDVVGTVNSVDTANQMINLNVNTVNNLRTTQNGQSVYYDNNTRVVYNNQSFNVTDLERGDQVSIRGANNGGRYVAETITVTRNVRG
ncbi:MAG TPA: DUF5666 domain-containing protein [Thermoanaerobaculia bacterium]|jgi:hypothetical protein|nr:DUF5666 domain-containing protein [Thermoanaerobaculia bacterium]